MIVVLILVTDGKSTSTYFWGDNPEADKFQYNVSYPAPTLTI